MVSADETLFHGFFSQQRDEILEKAAFAALPALLCADMKSSSFPNA
jgi:hypothetical protein